MSTEGGPLNRSRSLLCRAGLAALLLCPFQLSAQGVSGIKDFLRVAPEDVKWVKETDGSGVERATLMGDPTKPGIYVTRIKFPRGMMSRPHYHQEDRHAVVIAGTWYTGTGERFAPEQTVGLKAGSYMLQPAGEVHFDGAKDEEVIVQIVGYGPSSTVRLRPQDGAFGPSLPR
jgi:quercetin dioxygenase-like cupin family protein